MAEATRSLDAEVRRVDEDRWLASRFAPRDVRARLIALYALNHEIARTAEVVSEAGVGAIRLAWWRDAIEEVLSGARPRPHSALIAFAETVHATPLDAPTLRALIEARALDFEPAPFATLSEVEDYVVATAGGIMKLAMATAAPDLDQRAKSFARHAGLAWGLTGLLRAEPFWRARGRRLLTGEDCSHPALIERARLAYAEARALAPALDSNLFPAIGYVAFAPDYLRALAEGRAPPALLVRQLKLIAAAASGRI